MVPNHEQQVVLRYALNHLIDSLKCPLSADRAADAAQADRHIEVAAELLRLLSSTRWARDDIQFPRLIAEIMATQERLDLAALAESMDLSVAEVGSLFDRAQQAWDAIKADTCAVAA